MSKETDQEVKPTEQMRRLTNKQVPNVAWMGFLAGVLCVYAGITGAAGHYGLCIPLFIMGVWVLYKHCTIKVPMTFNEEVVFLTRLAGKTKPTTKDEWLLLLQRYPNIAHTVPYIEFVVEYQKTHPQ